jgi:hypothetical protein
MTPPLKPGDAENMSPYPLWLNDRAVYWPGLNIIRESLAKLLLTNTAKTVVALRLMHDRTLGSIRASHAPAGNTPRPKPQKKWFLRKTTFFVVFKTT